MESIGENTQANVKCSDEVRAVVKSEVSVVKMETDDGDEVVKAVVNRENRLTSIIDQLRCQNKLKGTWVGLIE